MINPEKFFLAVVFTGLVTAHTGFWGEINTSAIAATYNTAASQILPSSVASLGKSTNESQMMTSKQTPTLPPSISTAIQNNLQQQTGMELNNFTITSSTPETWSDACLGLANSSQFCAQILTPGWRVIISNQSNHSNHNNDAQNTWIYRTNRDGTVLRVEK